MASAAALTLATQTANGAHSDGGFVAVDGTNAPGLYRLDLSDAVVATGVDSVVVTLKGAANMVPVNFQIQLVGLDLMDSVRGGLTALPNAAADAAGGLPISDAGGLDLDAKVGALTFTVANKVDANAQYIGGAAATAYDFQADATTDTTTIDLPAGASSVNDFYNNRQIRCVGGTNSGWAGQVSDYVGSTRLVTVTPAAQAAFDNTSQLVFGEYVEPIYAVGYGYIRSATGPTDRYSITFWKNGQPFTGTVTSPTLTVFSNNGAGGGDAIISAVTPTQTGSTLAWVYEATGGELATAGEPFIVSVTATIDGVSRTMYGIPGGQNG